nr:TMV resistance protein N-like [Malus domestica]
MTSDLIREGVFIEKIIGDIKGLLKPTDLKEAKHSVGIAFRMQEFNTKYLDIVGSPDVQIIGIWGTGGIGKTTLAKEICSKYGHSFSNQCYLEEVRSNKKNMVSLQEQLLRDLLKRHDIKVSSVAEGTKEIEKRLGSMKVLVVVDDIDDADQLDKLAISHVSFGPGSRIIITTRDEHVLNIQKVDKRYKAQGMTNDEAFELLSWHAFGNPRPDEEYIELARDVVDYCGGLPLALEVVGRLLATKKSKSIWKKKNLRMHDLIRDMGREILRAESSVELGKRSRLWHSEDAKTVLRNKLGTEAVEGLTLFLPKDSDDEQSFTIPADFDQRNLVFMQLTSSKIVRVWEDSNLLPKKLKYLILGGCHNLTKLPDFSKLPLLEVLNLGGCKGLCGAYHFLAQLKMIQALNLSNCNITDGAVLEIIGSLSSLRALYLSGNGFNRLPILSGLSQLQFLRLNHCTNLQAIPDLPNSLIELEANNCTALEIMSDFSEMSKMRKLELKECRKLKDIPNLENSLDYMVSIHMEGCTSLTGTFKENLQTKNAFGGIFLSGNDIPHRLAYVAREDEIVQFVVPQTN